MRTVRVGPAEWVRYRDVQEPRSGRFPAKGGMDECWDHLEHRATFIERALGASERRTASDLVVARIRGAIRRMPAGELERRFKAQEAAVDHLLGHVPKRARPVSPSRLAEFVEALKAAHGPLKVASVVVEDEDDAETPACHRLTATVSDARAAGPEAFALRSRALHAILAGEATPEEYEAVRLIVVPE